jgi:hypothetical protein
MFYTYVTKLSECCIYFVMTFQVFSGFLQLYSDVCCKYFHLDVFKSRSGVAYVAMTPVPDGQRPAAGLRLLPRVVCLALSSPPLSSPSPPFPSLVLPQ